LLPPHQPGAREVRLKSSFVLASLWIMPMLNYEVSVINPYKGNIKRKFILV
jgi:hypothetical protein